MSDTAILLIKCPDRPGIIAAISGFLFGHGANITDLDQHSTEETPGVYFMRLALQTAGLDVSLDALRRAFAEQVARPFAMEWSLEPAQAPMIIQDGPPEGNFPLFIVVAHGTFAVSTVVLVLLSALGIG